MRVGARSGAAIWGAPVGAPLLLAGLWAQGAFQGGVSNDFLKFGFCFWA